MAKKKPVIGILGGIASGKSTVARHFGQLGCAVIEADAIAHEVLQKDEVKDNIVRDFGPDVLDGCGRLDRKSLARIVFENPAALDRLNRLIHPPVMDEVQRRIAAYQQDPTVAAVVLDVPLLAEVGRLDLCDAAVFVEADEVIRLKRLQKKGNFDEKDLKKREKFQISLDKKKKLANYSVCNNSDQSDLAEQVAGLFSTIISGR